ncbi:hypothetical protein L6164_023713 [Bauhinia variegata]|uniref:Uncharacterized protein n=1 Tax=Bauhinia variegata TaxID=167791 RepID=A0ACB9MMM4_BAUVA|nr:hypothetical protein L6164_023713 [Bauhinia variegata]
MPPPVATPKANLLSNQLVTIDHLDCNRLLPRVHVDDKVFNNFCQPWVDTLAVKLLGKILSYNLLKDKLKRVWKLQSNFDLMAIANGYFMVKFNLEDDREQVVNGGSWMVFGHYPANSRWTPEFVTPIIVIHRTQVWIRFLGLNLIYYKRGLPNGVGISSWEASEG